MELFCAMIYGLAGAVTGSFLNVCILRIPEGKNFIFGRSFCPLCGRRIPAEDMIPILSWLLLGGKCRFCRGRISFQYPAVEAMTALLFFLCCLVKGPGANAMVLCLFGSLLTVAAWIDSRYLYIPDGISILILLLAAVSAAIPTGPDLQCRIEGAVLCGGFLALISILTRGGVGCGDIKLLASSGLLLGVRATSAAILSAYILAGLWYAVPLIRGRVNGATKAPMAPFFALSLIIFGLWHREILLWYTGLFLP